MVSDMAQTRLATVTAPNDLESYWLPFTPNRSFKRSPRLIVRAKDMYYYSADNRALLDGTAGLWCTNAGHNRDPIVTAIKRAAEQLDYSPAFQFAHPAAFELAGRVAALAPGDLNRVFFCNSGSEAVDTALKIALAYHNVRGEGSRTRLIGRERGYHGVGFGGISVGGIVNNRKFFGSLLAGVDHLPATYSREHQAFTKGEPQWGAPFCRRTRAPCHVARCFDHRRRDCRTNGRLDRRAAAAARLPASGFAPSAIATAFFDLRRGDYRFRTARLCLCRRALWGGARLITLAKRESLRAQCRWEG